MSPLSLCICIICLVAWIINIELVHSVDCSSAYSCINQSIDTTEWVRGYGYKSLFGRSTDITISNSYLSCGGAFSCNNIASISTSGDIGDDIFCHGSNSCANIKTSDFMNNIYCTGSHSCQQTNINSSTFVTELQCLGYLSCANSQIERTNLVVADGAYSLLNGSIAHKILQ